MKKESLQLGLGMVCAVLFIAVFANRSEAHYVPTLSGWVYHSLECNIVLKSIPKQGVGGLVTCSLPATEATVFCANPNGHFRSGKASLQPISGSQPIPPDAGVSKGGKGTYTATVNVFDPVLSDFQFACPGQGDWTVLAVVITSFTGNIIVTDAEGDIASQVVASCLAPEEFQTSPPPPNTSFQYICNVLSQHLS
jgi:hypothetical protein